MTSLQRAILEVTLLAGGLSALGFLVTKPVVEGASRARATLSDARARLDTTYAIVARRLSAHERFPSLQARLKKAEGLVPKAPAALEHLQKLRQLARESALRVVSDKPAAASTTGALVCLRKEWTVEGSFAALVQWLKAIESRDYLVTVSQSSLTRTGSTGAVRCEISVDTFHLPQGKSSLLAAEGGS
jgi:hypothetical protein